MQTENQTSAIGKHLELHLQLQTASTEDSPKVKSKNMSKNNWKQFTSLPLTLTVFSPMPMPRLPDPRIPWFLGAQSFTVNLEVSPKHPPILWKLPVQSFPSYRTGFQNTSSHLDSKTSHSDLWILHCIRDKAIWQHSVTPAIDHDVS